MAKISNKILIYHYLKINDKRLFLLIKNKLKYYEFFNLENKITGKVREIKKCTGFLEIIQQIILNQIFENIVFPKYVKGGVKNESIFSNVSYHIGSNYFIKYDLEIFFPSISKQMVYEAFIRLNYPSDFSENISELVTINDFLPQGTCTSTIVANLVFKEADKKINLLCKKNGIKYTRYIDDLCFSSLEEIPLEIQDEIVKIINDTGFILNDKKTEIGIGKINITGITLTKDNIFLRRNFFKDFRDKSIFKKVITKKCEINTVKSKRVKNTNALAPNKRDEGKENFYVYFLKNRQEIKKGLLL